ncbi:MAG: hypothetical protein GXP45_08185 [bacterium]|nr:hypothetical protein [bacterium]
MVLREALLEADFSDKKELHSFLKTAILELINARATEPMLQNGMKCALWHYKKNEKKTLPEIVRSIDDALQDLLDRIYTGDKKRAKI